ERWQFGETVNGKSERSAFANGVSRKTLKELRFVIERDTPIPADMLVATLEALIRVAQQKRPRRQDNRAALRAIFKRPGHDRGYGNVIVLLFDGRILGARSADDILDAPAVTGSDRTGDCIPGAAP